MAKTLKKSRLTASEKRKIATRYTRYRWIVGSGVILLALIIISASLLIVYPGVSNNIRKERIVALYNDLKLTSISDDYIAPVTQNVFGDKRVYTWDKGRTYSSERNYIRKADVDTTAKELDKAMQSAGFSFYETRYPGSNQRTPTYKTPRGEYIRVTVESKPHADAYQNAAWMGKPMTDVPTLDTNAGPSNVTIKVNLDDNNE